MFFQFFQRNWLSSERGRIAFETELRKEGWVVERVEGLEDIAMDIDGVGNADPQNAQIPLNPQLRQNTTFQYKATSHIR